MYDLAPSYEGWCGLTTRHAVPSRPGSLLRRIDCRRGASHYGVPHIRRASPGAIIPRAGESSGRSSSTPRPHALHCSILLPSSPWLSSNANAVSNSQGKSPQQPQCSSPFASQQVFSGQASPQNGFSIAVQPSHPTPSRYSHSLQSMPHRDSIIRTYSISRFIARKTIRRPSIRPLVTCALQ